MSFAVVSVIFGDGTVASVLYVGVGSRIVMPGVLRRDLALASLIWRTRLWFIVVVALSHSVCLVVMDVGMLGLVYCGVGAGTVSPGVYVHDIALAALTWRTGPWFLVAVA